MKVADNALGQLQKTIRERMNELADVVSTGQCNDFEHYKHITGQIWGLGIAERELLDLNKLIEDDE